MKTQIVNHRLEGAGKGHGDRNPDAHKTWPRFLDGKAPTEGFKKVGEKRIRKVYPRI